MCELGCVGLTDKSVPKIAGLRELWPWPRCMLEVGYRACARSEAFDIEYIFDGKSHASQWQGPNQTRQIDNSERKRNEHLVCCRGEDGRDVTTTNNVRKGTHC